MRDGPPPLARHLRRTIRNPSRALRLRRPETRAAVARTLSRYVHYYRNRPPETAWEHVGHQGVQRKRYGTYEDYLRAQSSKLGALNLAEYDRTFFAALTDRLLALDLELSGAPVLCLAARIGTEVRAFQECGSFAVGIDLNPGPENRHVLPGDFHEVQFPDDSARYVYCNSLDHAFDLDRVAGEIHRVLAPGGVAIIEAMAGSEAGSSFGRWEATSWASVDDLVAVFLERGFAERRRHEFAVPWPGTAVLLAKAAASGANGG